MPKIILASKSALRKKILEDAEISFEVVVSDVDETPIKQFSFEGQQKELAMRKALTAIDMTKDFGDRIIVSADQNFVIDDSMYEKTRTIEDTRALLQSMKNSNEIYSYVGNAIIYISDSKIIDVINECDIAKMHMHSFTDLEMENYLATRTSCAKYSGINILDFPFLHLKEGKMSTAKGITIEYLIDFLSKF